MAAPNIISIDKLVRLIGTPKCPVLVDVRGQNDFDANPHFIPSSIHRASNKLEDLPERHAGIRRCNLPTRHELEPRGGGFA